MRDGSEDSQQNLRLAPMRDRRHSLGMDTFAAVCTAGSFRGSGAGEPVTHFSHRWTDGGVDVTASFTGAHLLHAAIAACVLNDLYREAQRRGISIDGVRVTAEGGFSDDWSSTGVSYRVEVDSPVSPAAVDDLIATVDEVAEIPRALRAGAPVTRVG